MRGARAPDLQAREGGSEEGRSRRRDAEDLRKDRFSPPEDVAAPLTSVFERGDVPGGEVGNIETFRDVSTYPGIRPFRKSRTMLPVGVGARSRGPTGRVGCTRTTGRPSAAGTEHLVLGHVLRSLVLAEEVFDAGPVSLVGRGARFGPSSPTVPTVLV